MPYRPTWVHPKIAGIGYRDRAPKPEASTQLHLTTKTDLLENYADLMQEAIRRVSAHPARDLTVKAEGGKNSISVSGTCLKIDRLDFYVDDQPMQTIEVPGDDYAVRIDSVGEGDVVLEIRGFARKVGDRNTSATPDKAVARYKQEITVSA